MVSPSPSGAGQRAAFLPSIFSASASRNAGVEELIEIGGDPVGVGDDAVAHAEGALGRLDQAVDVLEAFGLRDAQAVEQRKDDQRGQALRRRRRVVERAGLRSRTLSGSATTGFVLLKIGARHRAADALQVGGDLAADIAAVEIVEPGLAEMVERVGEGALLELARRPPAACRRAGRLAESPRASSSSAYFSTVSRAWLRVTV